MFKNWIWLADGIEVENERACFATEFIYNAKHNSLKIRITAVTRYVAYLNGIVICRGPARSAQDTLYYDTVDLSPLVKEGKNYLAIEVWHYGHSTYQTIANAPRLAFSVYAENENRKMIICSSDNDVKCTRDMGHQSYAPKRNVNLGFSDYYDARLFSQDWIKNPEASLNWKNAKSVDAWTGNTIARPTRLLHQTSIYPERLISIEDVKQQSQQVSINTRSAFFGDRRDANETIFSGLIGCVINTQNALKGNISFPNRTWNGIIGDFRINGKLYSVSNEHRDVPVELPSGQSLIMIQASGKFDDLFCHIDFIFPERIDFLSFHEKQFFVIGPTTQVHPIVDGVARVYGGINEFNRLEEHSAIHQKWFAIPDFKTLAESNAPLVWIENKYVFRDQYLLSLAMHEKIERKYAIDTGNQGILWNNNDVTRIEPPKVGDYRRLILDFGKIRIGTLNFTVLATEGASIDFYGFENYYQQKIDFTLGLNNALRYTCCEGWQNYLAMSRMGFRYLLITIRNTKEDVTFKDLHIENSWYPPNNQGIFECSDELLNRIWQMSKDTQLLSAEDCFADSPTYEQAFWIGDSQLGELVYSYLFGDYSYIWHAQKLAASAFSNTKLMNALTPTDWTTAIPLWMMNWVISIFQTAELSGDHTVAQALYPQMRDTLQYYRQFVAQDGGFLINAWNMLDWAPLDIENYGVVTGQQATLSYCYRLVAALAKKINELDISQQFLDVSNLLCNFINTNLWDNDRQAFIDGWSPEKGNSKTFSIQTHTLLYLYNAIIDPVKRQLASKYLENTPDDFIQVGSPFMLAYTYECWAMNGSIDRIMEDIKCRWQEMLKYDTNTCWEVFPGFYENNRTRSYCHNWSSTPAYFMTKFLSGVRAVSKDYSAISIELPYSKLRWCRVSLPTRFGRIDVSWEKNEGNLIYHIWAPRSIKVTKSDCFVGDLLIHELHALN